MMLQLSFEAVTGDSWDSDIALDEITWETGQCGTLFNIHFFFYNRNVELNRKKSKIKRIFIQQD